MLKLPHCQISKTRCGKCQLDKKSTLFFLAFFVYRRTFRPSVTWFITREASVVKGWGRFRKNSKNKLRDKTSIIMRIEIMFWQANVFHWAQSFFAKWNFLCSLEISTFTKLLQLQESNGLNQRIYLLFLISKILFV